MTDLRSHFVFATTASFSHVPPVISLVISLLTLTPDLCISVILHKNNEVNANRLISLASPRIDGRVKLYPVGEIAKGNDAGGMAMTLVYKGGEAYASILTV